VCPTNNQSRIPANPAIIQKPTPKPAKTPINYDEIIVLSSEIVNLSHIQSHHLPTADHTGMNTPPAPESISSSSNQSRSSLSSSFSTLGELEIFLENLPSLTVSDKINLMIPESENTSFHQYSSPDNFKDQECSKHSILKGESRKKFGNFNPKTRVPNPHSEPTNQNLTSILHSGLLFLNCFQLCSGKITIHLLLSILVSCLLPVHFFNIIYHVFIYFIVCNQNIVSSEHMIKIKLGRFLESIFLIIYKTTGFLINLLMVLLMENKKSRKKFKKEVNKLFADQPVSWSKFTTSIHKILQCSQYKYTCNYMHSNFVNNVHTECSKNSSVCTLKKPGHTMAVIANHPVFSAIPNTQHFSQSPQDSVSQNDCILGAQDSVSKIDCILGVNNSMFPIDCIPSATNFIKPTLHSISSHYVALFGPTAASSENNTSVKPSSNSTSNQALVRQAKNYISATLARPPPKPNFKKSLSNHSSTNPLLHDQTSKNTNSQLKPVFPRPFRAQGQI